MGRASSARSVVGVLTGGEAAVFARLRNSSAGKPHGDSGAVAMMASGIARARSASAQRD